MRIHTLTMTLLVVSACASAPTHTVMPPERNVSEVEQSHQKAEQKREILKLIGTRGAAEGKGPNAVGMLSDSGTSSIGAIDSVLSSGDGGLVEGGAIKAIGATGPSGPGGASGGLGGLGGLGGVRKGQSVGGRTNLKTTLTFAPPKLSGGQMDPSGVTGVLKRRTQAFKRCYLKEITKNPTQRATSAAVTLQISKEGVVTSSQTSGDDLTQAMTSCLNSQMRRLRFPQPQSGAVQVETTLRFSVK